MKWGFKTNKRTDLSPRIVFFLPSIALWQDSKGRTPSTQISFDWLVWHMEVSF